MTIPIIPIAIVVAVIIILAILQNSYKKVRPNEVMIITGAGLKEPKVIKGGGAFVIPGIQQRDVLDLSSFTLSFTVESTTKTQVPLIVDGTATLNIGDDASSIATAGRKFLGLTNEERDSQLQSIVEGSVRGILGTMPPEEVSNNKKNFSAKVDDELSPKLGELGIEVAVVQINDVTDEKGYLDSLYAEDVANKKADAKEAEARADARARAVQAEQDQLAKEAEQVSAQKIAEREKDTDIAKAKFKASRDAAVAIADQAYKLSQAEASKETITKEGEADAIRAEKEAIIAEAKVKIEKAKLESEIIAKTDAEAKARRINAETESITRKALAETSRFEKEETARADAEQVRLNGIAQAEAIKSRGLAEAEAKEALAKALANEGQAVLQQQIIALLPELARALAEPLSNIDNMTVFNGTQGVTDSIAGNLAQTFQLVKDSTGLDLVSLTEAKAKGTMTLEGDQPLVTIGGPVNTIPNKKAKPKPTPKKISE